jgi:hypothetical protein
MSQEYIWAIALLSVALIVGVAIYRRFNVNVRWGDKSLNATRSTESSTTVGANLQARGAEIGNVTGEHLEDGASLNSTSKVDVLSNADISQGKVGDITGKRIGK